MNLEWAVQRAIRDRLTGDAGVTSLVPANHILDRNGRPAPDPSIIFGEDQVLEGGDIARKKHEVISTLHVWAKSSGLVEVKKIAGAIRTAIHSGRLTMAAGFHCGDCRVSSMRFLRDPDGETGHGVVTVESLVREV